jgi:cytoskeleton protein RodZ
MNAVGGDEDAQAAELLTPGELLRRERERRRLSIQQAAEDMHLDARIVEAIEANRFVALGAPVYAKGHLRKYATLLGLEPELVIARYVALGDVPVEPTPIPASGNASPRTERMSLKKPLLALALLSVGAAVWWVVDRLTTTMPDAPSVAAPAEAPTPQVADPVLESAATSAPTLPVESQGGAQETAEAPQASIATTPDAALAPAARVVRLRLEFSDASWAEVYDGAGEKLMFDMVAAGRVRNLSGTPPLRVTLGAASAVSAQVNDQPIVIPRRPGRDAAKFVIDAAGVVTPGSGMKSGAVVE